MGKFEFQMDPEFVRMLERMGDIDVLAPKVLEGAAPILKAHVIAETDKHHEYSKDYELVKSIKSSKAFKNKYGWYLSVRPTGTDKSGVRNMEKMAHLEYGYYSHKNKIRIQPIPILTKAINDAKSEVERRMQQIFEEEVNGR